MLEFRTEYLYKGVGVGHQPGEELLVSRRELASRRVKGAWDIVG